MNDLRKALYALLLSDGNINLAVGGNRVYPSIVPQGETRPTIVQHLISEASDIAMDGRTGLGTARVQLNCWAQTQDQAVSLANMVFDRLAGYHGVVAEIVIKGVFLDLGRDDYDPVAKLFTRQRDYQIWYSET